MVRCKGVEPLSSDSKSDILSVKLTAHVGLTGFEPVSRCGRSVLETGVYTIPPQTYGA
jgi:hypothetical protein